MTERVSADEAIPRLLDRHGPMLLALGRRVCPHPQEAEDLLQETFLQAYRKWDQFEGRSDPGTWLYRIATRLCRRLHRRRSGEPERLESLEELLPFEGADLHRLPDVQLEREERMALVGRAVSALPDDFRMPLILKDVAGLPLARIAEILDLQPATLRSRLHRARLKVRKELLADLPRGQGTPPAAYPVQVCLDLLEAKQASIDRGVPMAEEDGLVCERCRALFESLDFAADVCRELGGTTLPGDLRGRIVAKLEKS